MFGLHPIVRPLAIVAVVSVAVMNTSDLRKFGYQLSSMGPTTTSTSSDCSSGGFTLKRQCSRGARFVPGN